MPHQASALVATEAAHHVIDSFFHALYPQVVSQVALREFLDILSSFITQDFA